MHKINPVKVAYAGLLVFVLVFLTSKLLPEGYLSKTVVLSTLIAVLIVPLIISFAMMIFEDTSEENHPEIQELLTAYDPESSSEELMNLSRSEETLVRLKVAENPSTPAIALFQLFEEGGVIREAVVKNPNFNLKKYIDEFIKDEDLT